MRKPDSGFRHRAVQQNELLLEFLELGLHHQAQHGHTVGTSPGGIDYRLPLGPGNNTEPDWLP